MPLEGDAPDRWAADQGCGPIRPSGPPLDAGPGGLDLRILECVRASGHIARVDLAKDLDVSPATITAMVSEQIARGLLVEVDRPVRPGQRGRPPTALSIVPEAGYVVGIRLTEFRHNAVLMDFAGRRVGEVASDRTDATRDVEHIGAEIEDLIARLFDTCQVARDQVLRVGIALPGFVANATGSVDWSPILPGGQPDFADVLSRRLRLPVHIDNDANLLTLAELWFGHGRRVADFVVVTIEQGIGMGLALGHTLYRGANGLGMELGHTKVQLDGALCRCGQRGCLEAYISDYALVREASTALDLSTRQARSAQVTLDALHDQAKAGNEAARTIFRRAGRFMALGLSNVVNLFDPSLIVVSGDRLRFDYLYADEVIAEMRSLIIQSGRPAPRIEVNAWGEFGWALGAAALALAAATEELV